MNHNWNRKFFLIKSEHLGGVDEDVWRVQLRASLKPLEHLSTILLKGSMRSSNAPSLCEDTPVSRTADVLFSGLCPQRPSEANIVIVILGLAKSFKTVNRPYPTWPDHGTIWRLISWKVQKIETWNLDTIFDYVFNLCFQNLELISLIVWKLYDFRQCSHFSNF